MPQIAKIDGEKSKIFRNELKTYLRRGQDGMVNKLKFANSKTDYLIQLADMCCSSIAYSYNRGDKLNADSYKKLLGKRIEIFGNLNKCPLCLASDRSLNSVRSR